MKPRLRFGKPIFVEDSSLVAKVFYDPNTDTLDAVFKKRKGEETTRYRYFDVSPKVFAKFIISKSMGKFFNRHIRPKFSYEKVANR